MNVWHLHGHSKPSDSWEGISATGKTGDLWFAQGDPAFKGRWWVNHWMLLGFCLIITKVAGLSHFPCLLASPVRRNSFSWVQKSLVHYDGESFSAWIYWQIGPGISQDHVRWESLLYIMCRLLYQPLYMLIIFSNSSVRQLLFLWIPFPFPSTLGGASEHCYKELQTLCLLPCLNPHNEDINFWKLSLFHMHPFSYLLRCRGM